MNLDIRKRLHPDCVLDRVYKITRPFDCDDAPICSDNFCKIDSRITGTGADIKDAAAGNHSGFFPAIQNHRLPGAVLHAQPLEFFVVSAEDVIALF